MAVEKSSDTEKFERMLEQGHDNPMLRFTLGTAYWKNGELDTAAQHLTAAVAQKNDYSAAWKTLGRVYYDQQQYQKAKEAYLSGLTAAQGNGDKQAEKEITVFMKRIDKLLSEHDGGDNRGHGGEDDSEPEK